MNLFQLGICLEWPIVFGLATGYNRAFNFIAGRMVT